MTVRALDISGRGMHVIDRYSGSCPAWPRSFTPGGKTHTCRRLALSGDRDVSKRWGGCPMLEIGSEALGSATSGLVDRPP